MMKLPPQVNTAFEMLEAAGYEAYLVGGAVRDYVRDNSPAKDWDITTNALPEQVEEIFTGYHCFPVQSSQRGLTTPLSLAHSGSDTVMSWNRMQFSRYSTGKIE